jgi:hypothetical protein
MIDILSLLIIFLQIVTYSDYMKLLVIFILVCFCFSMLISLIYLIDSDKL